MSSVELSPNSNAQGPLTAADTKSSERVSGLAVLFPQSWLAVGLLVGGFAACLVLASVPMGLAYGRFDIRASQCYDERTYYMKGPDDLSHPWCELLTYPYRLINPSTTSRLLPWLGYLSHQFGQWIIIWQAQRAKERGEVGWGPAFDAPAADGADDKPAPVQDYRPNLYAQRMFALNFGMVVFKFVQSHISYDGLATDVPESSALYSVAMWLFLSMALQMRKRGLIFGYWRSLGEGRYEFGQDMLTFIRKNHGYAFSFGATYNFWYHPIEGSPGFILGYLYQFCMILQSAFLFHPFHRNKFWTLILEIGVVPHSIFIALFIANQPPEGVIMFAFGFSCLFITTYMHGFDLSFLQKVGFAAAYFAIYAASCAWMGRSISNFPEVIRIGSSWVFVPMGWILWVLGSAAVLPFRSLSEKRPWLTGVLWFAIWAAQVLAFFILGPVGGRGAAGVEVP